jgi:hypothetical protein
MSKSNKTSSSSQLNTAASTKIGKSNKSGFLTPSGDDAFDSGTAKNTKIGKSNKSGFLTPSGDDAFDSGTAKNTKIGKSDKSGFLTPSGNINNGNGNGNGNSGLNLGSNGNGNGNGNSGLNLGNNGNGNGNGNSGLNLGNNGNGNGNGNSGLNLGNNGNGNGNGNSGLNLGNNGNGNGNGNSGLNLGNNGNGNGNGNNGNGNGNGGSNSDFLDLGNNGNGNDEDPLLPIADMDCETFLEDDLDPTPTPPTPSNPTPPTPTPTSTSPQVTMVGDDSITEGGTGRYRLQIGEPSNRDISVTIRIVDGTAVCIDGDGSGQSVKGDLRKGVMPELDRDFTVYGPNGRAINGGTVTLTIRAGQTTSEQITVRTWQERVSMGGRRVMTSSTSAGEGNENFSFQMVGGPGFTLPQPQMGVTIVDNTPFKWHSPLAIDLNNDGIKTLSLEDGVKFDLLNNGTPSQIGWISGKDGLLAVDRNGNGKIDNGSELFGGGVGEGFAKLASFDSNGDGLVDKRDRDFGSLKIWQDGNSNGVTDRGELQALSVFGIKSLTVAHTSYEESAQLDKQGNILGERGSVTTTKDKTLDMVDVYFQVASALPTPELG